MSKISNPSEDDDDDPWLYEPLTDHERALVESVPNIKNKMNKKLLDAARAISTYARPAEKDDTLHPPFRPLLNNLRQGIIEEEQNIELKRQQKDKLKLEIDVAITKLTTAIHYEVAATLERSDLSSALAEDRVAAQIQLKNLINTLLSIS